MPAHRAGRSGGAHLPPSLPRRGSRPARRRRPVGLEAVRRPTNTAVDIEYDLYFNGSDTNVQQFTLLDRFTISPVGIEGRKPQALFLATSFGPPFDNQAPWLVKVTL